MHIDADRQIHKTGLILEGGAMRGLFTAGVLDVLMEYGIHFDGIAGVSAGACFGCNFKSHQPGRAIRYNMRYAKDWRYCSWRSLLTTGDLFNADFCYRKLPLELDPFDSKAFAKDPAEFYAVCTDAETGLPVYHPCISGEEEDMQWIRASASMPVFSKPVKIGSQLLLDGGISDSIPLRFLREKGYEQNLVILTRPPGYTKKPSALQPAVSAVLHAYPAVAEDLKNRPEKYNRELEYINEQAASGYAFILTPEQPLPIGRTEHDPEKMHAVWQIGRDTAEKHLHQIQLYLEQE